MRAVVLVVIYVAFVSLGLPDAILGVAWPWVRSELALGLSVAGILAVTTTLGKTLASFAYVPLFSRLQSGSVVALSVLMMAVALLGYSVAHSLLWLFLCTIPLGLGAGAVDTGLNSYVAKHFSAMHINWLHGFWGLGAFLGPTVMNLALAWQIGWRRGFMIVAALQLLIAGLVVSSLSAWRKLETTAGATPVPSSGTGRWQSGSPVLLSGLIFLMYGAVEMGVGLWLTSYLLESRAVGQVASRTMPAVFFLCIAAGRLCVGSFANRVSNRNLIRAGSFLMVAGALLLWSNLANTLLASVVLLGIGCAPVFPAMIHETPRLFGSDNAERVTGYQVGSFYLGGVILLPTMGFLAQRVSLEVIPCSLGVFAMAIFALTESMYSRSARGRESPLPG